LNSDLERAVSLMRDFHAPWAIAGGWALDLFIGRESRSHADIDIAILRADQQQLRAQISGRVEKGVEGQLAEWSPTEELTMPVHEVHAVWSHLHDEQRWWLRQALDVTAPGHHWERILSKDA